MKFAVEMLLCVCFCFTIPLNIFSQGAVDFKNTHCLPQVVSGPDWRTVITVINSSDASGTFVLDFIDDNGQAIETDTSEGRNSRFEVSIKNHQTKKIEVLRKSGPTITEWARIKSALKLGVYLRFQQYFPGTDTIVGEAGVLNSPPRFEFTLDLDPTFGVALVNPGIDPAKINITVYDNEGIIVSQKNLPDMCAGCHLARFFNQEPFLLGNQRGKVVIRSTRQLSAVTLAFDGLAFTTLPILEAPRRLDAQSSAVKSNAIQSDSAAPMLQSGQKMNTMRFDGNSFSETQETFFRKDQVAMYALSNNQAARTERLGFFYFFPKDKDPQPGVTSRILTAMRRTQSFFAAELVRNGLEARSFDFARDADAAPAIAVVRGAKTRDEYIIRKPDGTAVVDIFAILEECRLSQPADWSHIMIFMEMFKIVNGQFVDGGVEFSGGAWDSAALTGVAFVSSVVLPFLDDTHWGDKRQYVGTPIPEFGNAAMPRFIGQTWDDLRDGSLHVVAHEMGHAFGLMFHSVVNPNYNKGSFKSLMDAYVSPNGFFGTKGISEGILLPPEARVLYSSPMMNPDNKQDQTAPSVRVVSKEFSNGQVRVVFAAEDAESGVSSVGVHRWPISEPPWTVFWKELDFRDQGNIEISFPVDKPDGLELSVFNARGGLTVTNLF